MDINIYDEAARLSSMGPRLKLTKVDSKKVESTKENRELDRYQIMLDAVKEFNSDTESTNENEISNVQKK